MTIDHEALNPDEAARVEAELAELGDAFTDHEHGHEHDDWDRAAHEQAIAEARQVLHDVDAETLAAACEVAADLMELLRAVSDMQAHEACEKHQHEVEDLLADRVEWYELCAVLLREQQASLDLFQSPQLNP